jgi:hypothetical protein
MFSGKPQLLVERGMCPLEITALQRLHARIAVRDSPYCRVSQIAN